MRHDATNKALVIIMIHMISFRKVLPIFCRNLSTGHLINWFSSDHLAAVLLKGEASCLIPS
jgi:DMSO/TMAO reductase YedYZ heme-binding membrane subunit